MLSKTLCFNRTLFRKNLTRFWPLWGGASLIGVLVPLSMLISVLQSGRIWKVAPLECTQVYYSVLCYAVPAISLCYAVLCAMAVWHYLFNPRSVGMYHSLPITRRGLFLTNFLSGMAMMAIPYAVAGMLTVLLSLALGAFDPLGLLVTVLGVIGLSFFYFSTATAVAFVTGNSFAMPVLYFIFHFLAAFMEWLVSVLTSRFYYGVYRAYEGFVEWLSPTLFLYRNVRPGGETQEVINEAGWVSHKLVKVTLENGWLIAVYALAGAALLAAAYALYQRRRSERAGEVVAVGWMRPIFRYGVAFCASLAGGMALYSLLWEGFDGGNDVAVLPMGLCMVLAGLIGYYAASMLLAKSLKVFGSTWKGAAATAAAAAVLCAVIALDPFGVENWAPQAGEVESLSFDVSGSQGNASGQLDDPEAIRQLIDIHQAIIQEKDTLRKNAEDYYRENRNAASGGDRRLYHGWLRLDYTLKGGRQVTRSYHFAYGAEDLQGGAVELLARTVTTPAVQEANIFGYSDNREITRFTGGTYSNLYDREESNFQSVDFTPEESMALAEAIRRDIQAGHFGRTVFMTDDEAYENTAYVGDLQLYYTYQRSDSSLTSPIESTGAVYITLSAYCTETVQTMERLGILTESRQLLTYAQEHALYNEDVSDGYDRELPESSVVYPDTVSRSVVVY